MSFLSPHPPLRVTFPPRGRYALRASYHNAKLSFSAPMMYHALASLVMREVDSPKAKTEGVSLELRHSPSHFVKHSQNDSPLKTRGPSGGSKPPPYNTKLLFGGAETCHYCVIPRAQRDRGNLVVQRTGVSYGFKIIVRNPLRLPRHLRWLAMTPTVGRLS